METQAIAIRENEEHFDYLESLVNRGFYGEITLYIQKGNIESCRVSERHTKKELIQRLEEQKQKKVLIPRPREKAGVNVCNG